MRILTVSFFVMCSFLGIVYLSWPVLRSEFRTTEDKIEGLLQLNGFWMEDVRCKYLDEWGSECARECCTGWSHSEPDYAINALFLTRSSKHSPFPNSPELQDCIKSQEIGDSANFYTSQIEAIKRVYINRGDVNLSSGRSVKTNKYTLFVSFGCAPD